MKSMFMKTAKRIGTFVLFFLGLSGGFTTVFLALGVNPTLILSVLGAPFWICYALLSRKLTKAVLDDRHSF